MCKLKEKSANNSLDILLIIFIYLTMYNLKILYINTFIQNETLG